jgi:hypothetical protein
MKKYTVSVKTDHDTHQEWKLLTSKHGSAKVIMSELLKRFSETMPDVTLRHKSGNVSKVQVTNIGEEMHNLWSELLSKYDDLGIDAHSIFSEMVAYQKAHSKVGDHATKERKKTSAQVQKALDQDVLEMVYGESSRVGVPPKIWLYWTMSTSSPTGENLKGESKMVAGVLQMMENNVKATEWFEKTGISTAALSRLTGGNLSSIRTWLKANQDFVEAHHKTAGIEDVTDHNRRAAIHRR